MTTPESLRAAGSDTAPDPSLAKQCRSASVAIRVDSGAHIGGGHLFRCLTLAGELRRRGASVRFVSREHPGHLLARLEECGFGVDRLPPPHVPGSAPPARDSWLGVTQDEDARETLAVLRGQQLDWLVVDHYGIDAEWEGRVGSAAERVMVIDDLANRVHAAALLVDQNYFGTDTAHRYEQRAQGKCRTLLGPRYALLSPEYRHLRESLPERSGAVQRILVFFGMHDPTRAISRVLQAMSSPEFAPIALDVVVGDDPAMLAEARSIARARPGTTVYEHMPSLAELIARADLAVGACGATTWERSCLGLPAVVATIADNQVALANALAAEGFTVLMGRSTSTPADIWRIVLKRLIGDPERVAALGLHARALTDGHGAGRVARAILGGTEGVQMRRSSASDEALLLEWANDPETRHFAFNQSRILGDDHRRWLATRLGDPGCMMLIGEDSHGLPLGQVRFDANGTADEATINISVDVALRGTGLGRVLLREAIDTWRKEYPGNCIIAEVVASNEASRRLFASAGFAVGPSRRPGTITFESRPA